MKTIFTIIICVIIAALLWLVLFLVYYYCKQNRFKKVAESINLLLLRSWKELTTNQLQYVSTLMLHENTATEIHTKCFLYFAGIKVLENYKSGIWYCKHGITRFTIRNYEVQYFANRLSFLTDAITEVNPLSEIAGYKHINPRFEGCPFKQWMAAENYYQAFLYTKNMDYLNCLCAVIYSDGRDFSDDETTHFASKFSKASESDRFTVFLLYSGFKNTLTNEFKFFFKKVNATATDNEKPKVPKMREHFNNIITTLNGGDITKTESVLNSECWMAFDMLNRKAQENQEMERRLRKMKGGRS